MTERNGMDTESPAEGFSPADRFAAIDFETADYRRDSACAVAVVVVESGAVHAQEYALIRPPRPDFTFTHIHGITWSDVALAPDFGTVWASLGRLLAGVRFIAAHNAGFDRAVLRACCAGAGITPPDIPYVCTVQLARRLWRVYPTKLSDVCRHFGIPLRHHQADSDALACAQIVLRSCREAFFSCRRTGGGWPGVPAGTSRVGNPVFFRRPRAGALFGGSVARFGRFSGFSISIYCSGTELLFAGSTLPAEGD